MNKGFEIGDMMMWIGNLLLAGALFLYVCKKKEKYINTEMMKQNGYVSKESGLVAFWMLLEFAVYSLGMIRLVEIIMREIQVDGENSFILLGVRIFFTESMIVLFLVLSMLYVEKRGDWGNLELGFHVRAEGESALANLILLGLTWSYFHETETWKALGCQVLCLLIFFILFCLKLSRWKEKEQREFLIWSQYVRSVEQETLSGSVRHEKQEILSVTTQHEEQETLSRSTEYERMEMLSNSTEHERWEILSRSAQYAGKKTRGRSAKQSRHEIRCYPMETRKREMWSQSAVQAVAAMRQQRQADYFKNVDMQYQRTRELWHDLKNHIGVLEILAKEERLLELTDYLNSFKRDVEIRMIPTKTGCTPVDAILSDKVYQARRKEIDISIFICDLSDMTIPAFDMCAVLGNLLDNAMEACGKLLEKGKIVIRMKRQENFYFLTVINSALEPVRQGNEFVSEKKGYENGVGHGLGLRSVERIAHQYGGSLVTDYENGEFKVVVRMQELC